MKTWKSKLILFLSCAFLAGCERPTNSGNLPGVDLHEAARVGNLEATQQHIATGADLNQKDPIGGSTPLVVAAVFGQTAVASALIEAGADLNVRNNEGSTALISAAFFGHREIVELLLAKGADKSIKNHFGSTALDAVAGPFEEVKGAYDIFGATLGPLGLKLDYEKIKATRPQIAALLR